MRPFFLSALALGWLFAGLVGALSTAAGTEPLDQVEGTETAEVADEVETATLRISGLGLIGNRGARLLCRKLLGEAEPPPVYPSSFVEDAALLLLSQVEAAGFLKAEVEVSLILEDGQATNTVCRRGQEFYLPVEARSSAVHLRVVRGLRYYFAGLEFEGLEPREARRAEDFFYAPGGLFKRGAERPYSPDQYARSLNSLRTQWVTEGYRRAVVESMGVEVDDETGAVRARVRVDRGPRFRVRDLAIELRDQETDVVPETATRQAVEQTYTVEWEQDTLEALARDQYMAGYPDAAVRLETQREQAVGEEIEVDLLASVVRGPRIRLGQLEYAGQQRTREGLLRDKTRMTGPYLNRIEADRGRERLSRLGIFRSVYVSYPEVTNDVRNVRFQVEEGRHTEVRAILGYGSYDLAFGGLELSRYNLFGIGHSARLYGVQSFKSTVGRLTYSVPEFLAPDLTAFASANALLREELTFDRRELAASAGLLKAFPRAGQQMGLRYSYEFLRAEREQRGTAIAGPTDTRVGAVILDWSLERRKSPLRPRRGHRAFASVEVADAVLGGEARYERFEVGGSLHLPLTRSLFLHLGAWHGVAAELFGSGDGVPFNKRFFPGGANSVRGYQQGEASPVDADGNQLGAESALIGNVELEKALTRSWSVVAFLDTVGNAQDMGDYPFDEVLSSAGAGLRWNTPVGPVRLEYGHNLNRRPTDPSGTLHVSIGFPF